MIHLPAPPFKASHRNPVAISKPLLRFAGVESNPLKQLTPKISNALKHFDFRDVGYSHVSQIQLVYAACILWRLVAANQRRKASPTQSWNEIRESALRDSVGYAFWFFGTPTLQRLYLKTIPKDYEKALIRPTVQEKKGLWQEIKKWNPISGYAIPTSEQVRDMKNQALKRLKEAEIEKSGEGFQRMEAYYKKLLIHRNMAAGVGLLSTIGLLGIGINYLNFYLTRQNVKRRETASQKPQFPKPPTLPTFQPLSVQPAIPLNSVAPPQWPGMSPPPLSFPELGD